MQKFCQIFHNILLNLVIIPPISVGQPLVIRWLAVKPKVR